MNKAYVFRIEPNAEQEKLLAKTFGCCRFLYNRMLADKIAEYEKSKKLLRNTPAQYKGEFPWLKEVDSLALANVQLHLEKAYKNFFQNPNVGFPKFKAKHRTRKSYTTNRVNGNIRLYEGKLRLPKLGEMKIRQHRPIPEAFELKSVTIRQDAAGKYYASLLFVYENQVTEKKEWEQVLGIDFAMKGLAVFSDGTRAEYPMFYRSAEKRLGREQRALSRCKRGSRNYEKQKRKVAKRHEKIRNQRKDFQHKLSRKLADQYDVICVEDLDLKAMSQGMHLGKGVMDNGYRRFVQILTYKLEEEGKKMIRVDRYYPSSKTCSCCGRIKSELALSERTYLCECGNRMDRDVNAAINIRNEGIRILTDSQKSA